MLAENKTPLKRTLYNFIVKTGLQFLGKTFPDIHMSVPSKPSDRFIEYPFVMKNLPKQKGKLLDIGSSGSFFPLMAAASGYNVTGCDIRPYELLNKLEFENFDFTLRDILKDPLQNGEFDIVTCISTIEHVGLGGRYGVVENETADLEMAQAILKTLKPGGTALITVPYGVGEVIAPYHRIYDAKRLSQLASGFQKESEKYYILDKDDDWVESSSKEAEKYKGSADKYGLALLNLRKLNAG